MAFENVGITLEWEGEGINEKGIDKKTGKILIEVDPKYFRPTEVDLLVGDATKARTKLGWKPKYNVKQLCEEMVQSDLVFYKQQKYLIEGGHDVISQHE